MSREHEFRVNSVVSKLKTGERPDTGGLLLVSGWGWGRDASTGYADFAADMAALDSESLHVYDAQYLHCTVATLSSFNNRRSVFFHCSPADRDRAIQAWHCALEGSLARIGVLRPFELVFRSLETSPAATFLEADEQSNTMEAIRLAVREAAEDRLLCELSTELEQKHSDVPDLCSLKAAVHVPDIIHSTVMRLASEPSDVRVLREGLAGLRARWQPATVKVGELSLVHEKHPYMHLSRTEGEVRRYTLPFG